jgi:hypothetical protein
MNNEQIEELKQIRKELEVSKEDFLELSGLALNYKEYEKNNLSDEDVFELIKEGMMHIDNKRQFGNDPVMPKSVKESFHLACEKLAIEPVYMGTHEEMDIDFPSLI